MAITESEFAEKIKIKYPQYKDIDDSELVSRVLDKYPEYSSQLGEKEYSKNLITNSAKSVVSGGVQAAINAGAGVAQSYAMLLGDESDTSEEGIQEYLSQRRVQPRRGGSRMTAGKILAHRKRKNEVLQSLNENAHRLRTLANGIDEQFNIDPEFANSFVGQVSKGFGQMIGNIGAVAVGTVVAGPKGGIAAATGAIAPQMVSEAVNDAESTLGKSYIDMTEEEKDQVALASAGYATLGTAFEFAPVARIPWVKNFLKGKTKVPAGVLKSPRIRKEIAKGFAAEGFTEAAQGQLLDSLARATFDDDRELMSWDVLRQRFNEFAVGGVVGGGTSGGIATVQRAARGELFKPKETKEVQADGTTKEVFDITYTDRNTNEPVTIQIDAENQEDAARIAGERLVTSAVEGTIIARPKPAPEPVTQPEPGVTVEDEPTEVVSEEPVAEEVVTEEVIPEAEQAELQQELQEELDQPDVTAGAAPVQRQVASIESAKKKIQLEQDTIEDNETFFQFFNRVLESTGSQLEQDPSNYAEVAKQAVQDVQGFVEQNPRFIDYYNKDWDTTRSNLEQQFGSLSDQDMKYFRFITGLTSPSTKLPDNLIDATRVFKMYKDKGNLDGIVLTKTKKGNITYDKKKTGFLFRSTTGANKARALKVFDNKVQELGVDGAIEYFTQPVTQKELNQANKDAGYKGNIAKIGNIKNVVRGATGQDTLIPRIFIFGQKVGAYTINSIGDSRYTTTDIWESRFIRSYFKGMFEAGTGLPQNVDEQTLFQEFSNEFNKEFKQQTGLNLDPADLQAVRWFYILNTFKETGYKDAKTDDTISGYTAKAIKELYGVDTADRGQGVSQDPSQVQEEVTAQAAPIDGPGQPTPSQAEASRIQKRIEDTFGEIAAKIGTSINVNTGVETAGRYNASTGVIEINPEKIVELYAAGQVDIVNDAYVRFLMREEIVHGTVEKVLIQRGIKNTRAWYEQLGRDLTQAQRNEVNDIYNVEQNYEGVVDYGYGTEFARMIIQRGLYGNITEAFITSNKGKAYVKMVRVLKSVQTYITKALKGEVTTNPEAAGVIVEAAKLLQSVDPDAKLVEQKVVDEAMAYSEDVNPNGEVTSQQVAESGKPPSEKKLNINFARKYLLTVSSLLNSIHPRLKELIRRYYGAIQGEVLDYQKRVAPFFKKYRGIKNTKDKRRLKTLLLYSPVEQEGVDPLVEERNALLRKYGIFNDYQLEIRPVLNELYARLQDEGILIGFLKDYFPRSIKDLDKVKNRASKELRDAFRDFVKDRNDKIEQARKNIEEGNPQPGDRQLSKERTVQIGNEKTASLEAQLWDQFTRGFTGEGANRRRNLPGNFLSRSDAKELEVIPPELLDAYEDPGVAMERYIYNTVSAIQTTRLMGSKFANVPEGMKVPEASELGLLIQELKANGEISVEDADGTVPDIFAMILSPMQAENIFLQISRTFGYGTLLVEFTSTLSQLYDLPFIMLDNGIFGTAVAMFGPRLKGEDFGIDVNQVSAEFASDNRVLEKAVRLGLRATGFTKLDQVMKETNMTANYNRYRKLARGYYKDRNSSNSKKFIAELTAMGYGQQEQNQLIADLKKGNRDSAYIRNLLFNKLSETQPLTQAEMALGIVGNPNLRLAVAMKSFMIKQLNFVRDRMVLEFIDGVRTGNAQKIKKASNDIALLMTFMLLIGLPVDALKDFLAGRLGYMSDYLFNGVFRIAGVSRYTAYQARKEGVGQAAFDYVTPVAIQQFVDITNETGRVFRGERAITESKFVTLLPFSDVINRIFGFQKERERKEFRRRIGEGERPFLVPPGAI